MYVPVYVYVYKVEILFAKRNIEYKTTFKQQSKIK